jgi:hypothetical protein
MERLGKSPLSPFMPRDAPSNFLFQVWKGLQTGSRLKHRLPMSIMVCFPSLSSVSSVDKDQLDSNHTQSMDSGQHLAGW